MTQRLVLSRWLLSLLAAAGALGLLASATQAALPQRPWPQDVAQACKVSKTRVARVRPYALRRAPKIQGVAVAQVWKSKARRVSQMVAVFYKPCSNGKGWCPQSCLTLHQTTCAAQSKPACVHDVRAVRLLDLKASATDVDPAAGSWTGATVQEPKTTARWPLLLLQSQVLRGSGDKQRTQTHTVLLSLQTPASPRPLMKLVTHKQWPPILIAGRKQDPIGKRVRLLQFRRPAGQPIALTVIQQPIPSPFDRCCQPQDTYTNYQLAPQGFEEIQSL